MRRWIALLVVGSVLVGCQQNPFPAGDALSPARPVEHVKPKPTPIPAYVLTVPDVMLFHVKEEREYTIQASVPPPGTPVVVASDLPAGAHFYPNTLKFVWTPTVDQSQAQKPFVIQFALQSSADPIFTHLQKAVLVVEGVTPNPWVSRLGEEIRIPFTAPAVRIVPEQPGVEWHDQELVIRPSSPGLVSFEAVAILRNGREQPQAFYFWVIP